MELNVSRRVLLAGSAAAIAASGPVATGFGDLAHAKAPMAGTQAPYWYRFKLGAFEGTVVSDGPLGLGDPSETFLGSSKEAVKKALSDNFLAPDNVVLEQNVLVLNTGSNLVLFDNGTGAAGAKNFNGKTGKLLANLKAAGIDPKDITALVITHCHIDHCWGIMSDDGQRNFPNAQIYVAQNDLEWWTNEANGTKDWIKDFIAGARRNLVPNRERIVFVKDGQEVLPGIQAISTPGHTVGHTCYMLTSEGKSLCNIGDLTHHQILLMETPRLEFSFDTDPKQSAQSRVKTLDMLASQKIPMLAYHYPWPGIGHIGKMGDGFRYYPSAMQMTL
jgi:glyoxylase-like metal-dependent hydrolase (beta-lactamase superfamily II)